MKRSICVICGLLLFALVTHAQEQQFANIGDLKLQNGGVIRNCRIGLATSCESPRLNEAVSQFLNTDDTDH